ncbi:spartin-like [Babylonia areolata]|uniref:spartin-like n=1 Tax=Babylonia areolata TaxID=304850 RepID=UPI003FD543D5
MACASQERSHSRPSAPPDDTSLDTETGWRGREDLDTGPQFTDFKKLHDKAYAMVQKGLNADEEGDLPAARQYYIHSLSLLDQVLTTDSQSWSAASSAEIEAVQQMQLKTNKTKLKITYRLEALQTSDQVMALPDPNLSPEVSEGVRLPSYEEAMSSGPSSPVSEAGVGTMTTAASVDQGPLAGECLSADGTELFYIADGVQIFHITYEGYVSAPSYPTSLRIVRFQESLESDGGTECGARGEARAFLQVGDWLYPLIPGASPVLRTTFGAYLFPDLSLEGTGSSVGLILPSTLSEEEHHILEDILRHFSVIQEQQAETPQDETTVPTAPEAEPEDAAVPRSDAEVREEEPGTCGIAEDHSTSAKISRGIIVASSWISWGLGKGAEKAGQLITYGSAKLRERMHPESVPRPVDPRVQKGVMYARKASNAAVNISAFVVTKLGEATMALGRRVAPHLRKKGEELLPKSVKTDENKSRLHGVMEVAASGLQGVGTVWLSLEAAAKALGRSVAQETVATVHHKYGGEASKLAENTVYTAGNVAMVAYNTESLAVKAIIKRTAKNAGAAVVYDLQETSEEDGQANAHSSGGRGGEEERDTEKKEPKS